MAKVRISRRAKGVASVAIGALCLCLAGLLLNRAYAISNGREVEGRVSALRGTEIEVRYPSIKSPKTKAFEVGAEQVKSFRKGRRITVVVVSDNEAYLVGHSPSAIPIMALCLVSVFFLGGGTLAILRPA